MLFSYNTFWHKTVDKFVAGHTNLKASVWQQQNPALILPIFTNGSIQKLNRPLFKSCNSRAADSRNLLVAKRVAAVFPQNLVRGH